MFHPQGNIVFNPLTLVNYGGYCGGAFAWVLLRLFGFTVSLIIIVGLFVVGILIIGFSISAAFERMRDERRAREEAEESEAALFARMNLAHTQNQHPLARRRLSQRIDPRKIEGRESAHPAPAHAPLPEEALKTRVLDHEQAKEAQSLTRKLGPRKHKLSDAPETPAACIDCTGKSSVCGWKSRNKLRLCWDGRHDSSNGHGAGDWLAVFCLL